MRDVAGHITTGFGSWRFGILLISVFGWASLTGCTARGEKPEIVAAALPGEGADSGRIVIYRDTWGVPHIYAPTVEDGLYAQGYAQAQDRPQQLLMNFKMAMGEFTEVAGEAGEQVSLLSLMFDHYGTAQRAFAGASPQAKARLNAFVDGINAWYHEHPEDMPAWWRHPRVEPAMADAFGRMFLNNWSIDEAFGDLQRGGVKPGMAGEIRGSNQMAVAPSRSASGHAMLVIDPHLQWFGPSRFWEIRIHAGELHGSGVGLAGSPYIGLGHNRHIAWAMTTGGPDTADVYALTLDAAGTHYRFEDQWKPLLSREITLRYPDGSTRARTLHFSHHGPVIARDGQRAWAARIPYDENADRNAAWEKLNFATDYTGAVDAAATLAMFPQNMMVADTRGNIYYQRVGRVPKRSTGYDWSKPVPGDTPATAWQGFYPGEEQVHLLNPEAGYMQNCNIPPEGMIRGGSLDPDDYPPELWGSLHYGQRHGWTNLRGARALEMLEADRSITRDELEAIANDIRPYGTDRWLAALAQGAGNEASAAPVIAWDGQLHQDSVPALRYAYWRMELDLSDAGKALKAHIDDHYAIVEDRAPRSLQLTDADKALVRNSWGAAMQRLQHDLGTLDAPWGQVFRVGRDDRSWPVDGGGSDPAGLTTLRAMGYQAPDAQGVRRGERGQTSTQVVVLSEPIRSFLYLPVGQSDRKDSPHYDDQAETVFSQRRLKPSWWLPEDLQHHIESRTELRR